MERKSYLVAVGYPIGAMEVNKNFGYQVESEGRLFGFGLKNYAVWKLALSGIFYDKAKEIFDKEFKNDNEFDNILRKVIESKLVIEINLENEEDAFKRIEYLKPFRQGNGIGLKSDNNKYYVKKDREMELSQVQFTTWMQSNGLKTISELSEDYANYSGKSRKQSNTELIEIIFYLYKIGLIYLVR